MPMLIAFVVSLLILIFLLKSKFIGIAMDTPNHRSLHQGQVSRTGGIAIILGVAAGWSWNDGFTSLALSVAALFILSLADDIWSLPVGWRLVWQLAISAALVHLLVPTYGWPFQLVLVLLLTWMTNLYNFMDGSDGLAGGMAVFGFGTYGLIAWQAQDLALARLCATVVCATLAFLVFNFHPARIFMGDSGSIPLGFLAGTIGLVGLERGIWPAWVPALTFSPFIIDASLTLLRRLLRGDPIWQAHKIHYYQRLVRMGLGHRCTALVEYVLMAAVGLSSILLHNQPLKMQLLGLCTWLAIYCILLLWVDHLSRVRLGE